jgi:hypothetical protein
LEGDWVIRAEPSCMDESTHVFTGSYCNGGDGWSVRLASISPASCLCLLSAGITGEDEHASH